MQLDKNHSEKSFKVEIKNIVETNYNEENLVIWCVISVNLAC